VRPDSTRRVASDFLGGKPVILPTEVPITMADKDGHTLAGDAKGPILVSLDPPTQISTPPADVVAYPDGRLKVDQLGTANLAPLVGVDGKINTALATSGIRVITDTHGKTSQLTSADIDAIAMYLKSLQ
jgi:hypothetical protein